MQGSCRRLASAMTFEEEEEATISGSVAVDEETFVAGAGEKEEQKDE